MELRRFCIMLNCLESVSLRNRRIAPLGPHTGSEQFSSSCNQSIWPLPCVKTRTYFVHHGIGLETHSATRMCPLASHLPTETVLPSVRCRTQPPRNRNHLKNKEQNVEIPQCRFQNQLVSPNPRFFSCSDTCSISYEVLRVAICIPRCWQYSWMSFQFNFARKN